MTLLWGFDGGCRTFEDPLPFRSATRPARKRDGVTADILLKISKFEMSSRERESSLWGVISPDALHFANGNRGRSPKCSEDDVDSWCVQVDLRWRLNRTCSLDVDCQRSPNISVLDNCLALAWAWVDRELRNPDNTERPGPFLPLSRPRGQCGDRWHGDQAK